MQLARVGGDVLDSGEPQLHTRMANRTHGYELYDLYHALYWI
jgi:hypothetical protein